MCVWYEEKLLSCHFFFFVNSFFTLSEKKFRMESLLYVVFRYISKSYEIHSLKLKRKCIARVTASFECRARRCRVYCLWNSWWYVRNSRKVCGWDRLRNESLESCSPDRADRTDRLRYSNVIRTGRKYVSISRRKEGRGKKRGIWSAKTSWPVKKNVFDRGRRLLWNIAKRRPWWAYIFHDVPHIYSSKCYKYTSLHWLYLFPGVGREQLPRGRNRHGRV